jgi:AbrB family looped-hinge helix DNA binding protein
MPTTRLSSRGQVVLPKRVREQNRWDPGQEFEIVQTEEGVLLRPRSPFPETTFETVRGRTGYEGSAIPTDRLTGTEALRKREGKA